MPIILPTQKTEKKKGGLNSLFTLIYGSPKIGKSTFCSQAEKPLFLATEQGLNHLEVYKVDINSWADFVEAYKLLAEGNHDFKTVVIDTIDNLYGYCMDTVLESEEVTDIADLPYGKGFKLVNTKFHKALTAICNLGLGVIFTSHAKEKEVKTSLSTVTKIAPTLPESARKIVLGIVDLIFYAESITTKNEEGELKTVRVIRTKETSVYEAGDRTGLLPETIELNYSKVQSALEQIQENKANQAQKVDKAK